MTVKLPETANDIAKEAIEAQLADGSMTREYYLAMVANSITPQWRLVARMLGWSPMTLASVFSIRDRIVALWVFESPETVETLCDFIAQVVPFYENCPTLEDLTRHAAGRWGVDNEVAKHLPHCADCRFFVSSLDCPTPVPI